MGRLKLTDATIEKVMVAVLEQASANKQSPELVAGTVKRLRDRTGALDPRAPDSASIARTGLAHHRAADDHAPGPKILPQVRNDPGGPALAN